MEFDAAMTEIDREIRQDGHGIEGREFRALVRFCAKFRVSIGMGDPTLDRINSWFYRMYGDRIKINFDFGNSVASVEGDLYRMRCIRFWGNMLLMADPHLMELHLSITSPDGYQHQIKNLLVGCIDDLTPERAICATVQECEKMLKTYGLAFLAFSTMAAALDGPYIKESIDDLNSSFAHLLAVKPNYGQSNWDSLQATEKVIKSFISQKGGQPERTHNLSRLRDMAHPLGLPTIDDALIEDVQCGAGARYGDVPVSKDEAMAAYHGALSICSTVASLIRKKLSSSTVQKIEFPLSQGCVNVLMLGYAPPVPPA